MNTSPGQSAPPPLAELPLPLWHLDASGALTWCNAAYGALYGADAASAVARQKILGRQIGEKIRITTGGTRRLFAITGTTNPQGDTLFLAQDISAQELLEAESARASQGSRDLLSHLSTALARFDADQRIDFFNAAFVALWNLDEAWLLTRPKLGEILERLREGRRLPEQADFRRYKQTWLDMFTTLIDPFEDMMHLPTGQTLRMVVVPNPTGGLMYTFEDVTSRLELETSYNILVAVQRETLDHLHEGIAVFGGDGRLKLSNPPFAALWALNPEDLASEPHITELSAKMGRGLAAATAQAVHDTLMSQVLGGDAVQGRLTVRDDLLIDYRTVILPDGGVLASYTDVTDSVRVETALRDKNAALQAAERLKLDFLANVSYQLRTPLNAIMGFTEILDHEYFGPLNDKQKQYTAGTREASEKLLSLIDDILDLSTIEAGYLKLDYDDVDLLSILKSLQTLTLEWARKEGLEVILDIHGTLGSMVVDPRRLKQILINLIRNAIAFSPVGGVIELGAKRGETSMTLWVKDHGIGIDAHDQTRVLEPFERGKNNSVVDGRSNAGGAGLGLTLVREFTQLHGGTMVIQSAPGGGTTVTLNLPLVPPDNPA
jgi:signal transduction histidine kinase